MTIERFILMDSEIAQNLFKIIVNEEIMLKFQSKRNTINKGNR